MALCWYGETRFAGGVKKSQKKSFLKVDKKGSGD